MRKICTPKWHPDQSWQAEKKQQQQQKPGLAATENYFSLCWKCALWNIDAVLNFCFMRWQTYTEHVTEIQEEFFTKAPHTNLWETEDRAATCQGGAKRPMWASVSWKKKSATVPCAASLRDFQGSRGHVNASRKPLHRTTSAWKGTVCLPVTKCFGLTCTNSFGAAGCSLAVCKNSCWKHLEEFESHLGLFWTK